MISFSTCRTCTAAICEVCGGCQCSPTDECSCTLEQLELAPFDPIAIASSDAFLESCRTACCLLGCDECCG